MSLPADALTRFEALLLPLLDDAYTLARYVMGDEHDAQDVVQESYLRALRYFDGFDGAAGDPSDAGDDASARARAWLLTIVRNTARTWRRRDRARVGDVPLDEAMARAPRSSDADARVRADSAAAEVVAALDALGADAREVLVLRDVEEMSYKEIAHVVGVPIGTVMSRLARARARVQQLLGTRQEAG